MRKYKFKVGDFFIFNEFNYIIGKIVKINYVNRYGRFEGKISFVYKIIKEERIDNDYSEFAYNSSVYEESKVFITKEEVMVEML